MQTSKHSNLKRKAFSSTFGVRLEQSSCSGELAAIAHALGLLPLLRFCSIVLPTSNKAAVLTLRNLQQQSDQEHVCQIKPIRALRRNGNRITILWLTASKENELLDMAKERARAATQHGATPQGQLPRVKSATLI